MKTQLNPLVTIATVTYNSEKYVRVAIESILNSSYENFELLIADDKSTDNTWNIIQEYKDSRIIAWQNDNNIGEYPNRNKCIEKAKGKYFLFIDGDDAIQPHGLQTYVTYAEKYDDFAMLIQKKSYNNVIFPVKLKSNDIIKYQLDRSGLLSSSFISNFFVTSILKEEKLSTLYKTGDEEIRYRLAIKYSIVFIQGSLAWHRETPGQASCKLGDIGLIEQLKYIEYILIANMSDEINRLALNKLYSFQVVIFKRLIKYILNFKFKSFFRLKKYFNMFNFIKGINKKTDNYFNVLYTPNSPLTENNIK